MDNSFLSKQITFFKQTVSQKSTENFEDGFKRTIVLMIVDTGIELETLKQMPATFLVEWLKYKEEEAKQYGNKR